MNLKSLSTLQIALGFSLAVHAVLLTVRFVDPEAFNRVFQDSPLEVVLVNTRTNERAEKAQAIAQTSLAGGGDADKGRATSPLPPSALTELGDAEEDAHRKIEALQEQQVLMMASIKQQLATMPKVNPKLAAMDAQAREQMEKRRQMVELLAQIERRINEQNARPKKRYISPATREEHYAIYYDGLRRKIEDKGTRNFPEVGGRKLYGELVMQVAINFEGHVVEAVIEQSSGNATLDRRAQSIARSAGPFGVVPERVRAGLLRSGFNRLAFVQTFKFTPDETLETRLGTRQAVTPP